MWGECVRDPRMQKPWGGKKATVRAGVVTGNDTRGGGESM